MRKNISGNPYIIHPNAIDYASSAQAITSRLEIEFKIHHLLNEIEQCLIKQDKNKFVELTTELNLLRPLHGQKPYGQNQAADPGLLID